MSIWWIHGNRPATNLLRSFETSHFIAVNDSLTGLLGPYSSLSRALSVWKLLMVLENVCCCLLWVFFVWLVFFCRRITLSWECMCLFSGMHGCLCLASSMPNIIFRFVAFAAPLPRAPCLWRYATDALYHKWVFSIVSTDVPVLPFPSLAQVVMEDPSWDRIIEYQVGRDLTGHSVQPCLAKARSRKDALATCPAESEISNVEEPPNSLGDYPSGSLVSLK